MTIKNLIFCILFLIPLHVFSLTITLYPPIGSTVTYEKYELCVALDQNFANPYDYDAVNVYAIFTDPSGLMTRVDGFYYQPYSRCTSPSCMQAFSDVNATEIPNYLYAENTPCPWRIRFAPYIAGNWTYQVFVGGTAAGNASSAIMPFTVTKSANKGYIKVAPNGKNFMFTDGSTFIPLGLNHTTENKQTVAYNRMPYYIASNIITDMAPYGGNFLRIMMNPENFNIDWGALKNYSSRQPQAFDIDQIMALAEANNVYIQLCLDVQSELWVGSPTSPPPFPNAGWPDNPYHTLVANPDLFFTDANCISAYSNKMRYIVARWGYSTSLFGYEMFNEIDQYGNYWGNYNWRNIRDWHSNIISYVKNYLDNKHLFTTSATSPQSGYYCYPPGGADDVTPLYGIPQLDYLQEHFYGSDYNLDYQLNFLTNTDVAGGKKPSFLGETGLAPYNIYPYTFVSSTGNSLLFSLPWHNSLWSTAFSGGAPCVPWESILDMVGNNNGNSGDGLYKSFQPISTFFQGEDAFFNNTYYPIANTCTGNGPKDNVCDNGTSSTFPENNTTRCVPVWDINTNYPANDQNYVSNGITTSDDNDIEVFALKGETKTLGWIHSKENYWYPLPHGGTNAYQFPCTGNTINTEDEPTTYPGLDAALTGETVTIKNMCKGTYQVDFYGTYPSVPGVTPNMGIISGFSQSPVYVGCDGNLTFNIPFLEAFQNPIPGYKGPLYAPDYGFKVTKTLDIWSDHQVTGRVQDELGTNTNFEGIMAIANTADIYYLGQDGKMHASHPAGSNIWTAGAVGSVNGVSVTGSGNVAVSGDATNLFYQTATGNSLIHFYNIGGTWGAEQLASNVNGPIATNSNGSKVFFLGTDGKVHYLQYSGTWQDQSSYFSGYQNCAGDIVSANNGNDVFYVGSDNKLRHAYYNGTWNLETLWNSADPVSENIAGSLSVDGLGQNVVYKGTDGLLHYYYNTGTGWNHELFEWLDGSGTINYEVVNGQTAISQDGTHVFFEGFDGYIHQRYYLGTSGPTYQSWAGDYLICYNELTSNDLDNHYLACLGNTSVFYKGNDNQMHAFLFNAGCEETGSQYERLASSGSHYGDPQINAQYFNTTENIHFNDSTTMTFEAIAYPNPCQDALNIKLSNSGNYFIEIVNPIGSTIIKKTVTEKIASFDLQNYPDGIYFIKITDYYGKLLKTIKVVKI